MGGIGTIPGAIIGALVMASLVNGMSMMNIDAYWQLIVKGSILALMCGLIYIAGIRRKDSFRTPALWCGVLFFNFLCFAKERSG